MKLVVMIVAVAVAVAVVANRDFTAACGSEIKSLECLRISKDDL